MNDQEKAAAMVAGGQQIEVDYKNGKRETVLVRELPIKEFPKMLHLLDDEAALIELYCERPAGWSEQLTRASHAAIVEAGAELNEADFFAWSARRTARVQRLNPEKYAEVFQTAIKEAQSKPSPTGSGPSRSSAA